MSKEQQFVEEVRGLLRSLGNGEHQEPKERPEKVTDSWSSSASGLDVTITDANPKTASVSQNITVNVTITVPSGASVTVQWWLINRNDIQASPNGAVTASTTMSLPLLTPPVAGSYTFVVRATYQDPSTMKYYSADDQIIVKVS